MKSERRINLLGLLSAFISQLSTTLRLSPPGQSLDLFTEHSRRPRELEASFAVPDFTP